MIYRERTDYILKNGNLVIRDGVTIIEERAFAGKQIKSVSIPSSVKTIGDGAFYNNQLTRVEISAGVTTIGNAAFLNNQLTQVEIPTSVTTIGKDAFAPNTTLIFENGRTFQCSFIEKIENIPKLFQLLDIYPTFPIDRVEPEILNAIPLDIESIKTYLCNKKHFDHSIQKLKQLYLLIDMNTTMHEELGDFYKLYYVLGFFFSGREKQIKIEDCIMDMCKQYMIDDVHQMFTGVTLNKYYPKVAETILSFYDHPELSKIVAKYYNEYPIISSTIKQIKTVELNALKRKRKQNEENGVFNDELDCLIKEKKDKLNHINVEDILEYIQDHVFSIRQENIELKRIVYILSTYINQLQFDQIQDIYEQSCQKESDPYIFSPITEAVEGRIHYSWSKGSDPINIILGYLCNCCARYDGAGQDIVVQSMVNPYIKNLIIYDGIDSVIAKSTAFYNKPNHYILFNNIEVRKAFIDKATYEQKKEVFEAILRGIDDQIVEMRNRGLSVEEVRVGMLRNDLSDVIKSSKLDIVYDNLLANYPYNNYDGDANDKDAGQVIILKKHL